jgi:hypothetical protein
MRDYNRGPFIINRKKTPMKNFLLHKTLNNRRFILDKLIFTLNTNKPFL